MRIHLRGLVLALTIFSALVATVNALYASYRVQREQLIANTLEANRVYAAKLAESTGVFLKSAQRRLEYSARHLAARIDAPDLLAAEAMRLQEQDDSFNTVAIVRADGTLLATSQTLRGYLGVRVDTAGSRAALQARQPLISKPYVSLTGVLLLTVSHPILAESGRYLGYIAGTIYLSDEGALHTLLGRHPYQDGSYLYVVDAEGRLLYHEDPGRVGDNVSRNPVVAAVMRGQAGAQRLVNTQGVDMLAGYASVPASGWGVIAQRPTGATLEPLDRLIWILVGYATPFALLFLLAIWWCARKISQPLSQLATNVEHQDMAVAMQRVRSVRAWYFEARRLKLAVIRSFTNLQDEIGKLNQASITDPLTSLYNRRGLQAAVQRLQAAEAPFAVVALDIDHFKRVNDTHGHAVGDEVIRSLAQLMRDGSRPSDVLCRNGGEEFLMLLPAAGAREAGNVAERLRRRVQAQQLPGVGAITISAGVAQWPGGGADVGAAFREADEALYDAKQQGRNRVVTHAP